MLKKVAVLALLLAVACGVMMLTTREKTFAVENALTVGRPAVEIWQVLAGVERWPSWWPGVEQARLSPAWQAGAALDLVLKGTPEKAPATVEEVVAGKSMAWVRHGIFESFTRTSLRLEPVSGGTRVVLRSFIQGPQAFLAGFTGEEEFARYHQAVLAGLQAYAEQAERL